MPEEFKAGCARPTGSAVGGVAADEDVHEAQPKEEPNVILIGRKAPDFTAPGHLQGKFINLNLAEYLGKWVLLCFYPGDFTFV
jgi:hypothetical protein